MSCHVLTNVCVFVWQVPSAPLKQLFGFQKVFLPPGESVDLFFATSVEDFMLVDKQV